MTTATATTTPASPKASHALPKRSEVPREQTWNLDKLFTGFDAWEKAFAQLPEETAVERDVETKYKGRLAGAPALVAELFAFRLALRRRLMNLYVYAGLRNAEDVADSVSTNAQARIHARYASLMAPFAFVEPELLAAPQLKEWAQAKPPSPLAPYTFELSELLREKDHVLGEAEEKLLAKISPVFAQFGTIHSKWNNVDLKFPDALDSSNSSHMLTHGRYGLLTASTDRTLRKNAWENMHAEIAKSRGTIAANFHAKLLSGSLLAKARNYEGFRHSQLAPDDIPTAVYDTLVDTVRANLSALKESLAVRREALGIDTVFPYDRRVSLHAQKSPTHFTFDQACDLILKSLAPLGEEYVSLARAGLLEQAWVDWAENEGKRSGAFSWGTYDSNPVIHMTWTGTLDNVFTLAHELGHSMHTFLSNRAQPYHLASYTIFVAEVASTLNEALLADHILTREPTSELGKEVLSQTLEGFEGTVLRQVLFATFERDAAAKVDAAVPLGPDEFDALFLSLNKEWYGDEGGGIPLVAHEWMRIPHFYSTFYVYKYATSYCASAALLESLKENPTAARAKIMGLLQAGGSKPPLEILRDAGVDFSTPAPVDRAFQTYRRNIERARGAFVKSRQP